MDCNINKVKIQTIQNEISKMQILLSNNKQLSYNDKQEMLDSIAEKKREIEKLSRQDSMVVDIPAKKIKERQNELQTKLSENRYIL